MLIMVRPKKKNTKEPFHVLTNPTHLLAVLIILMSSRVYDRDRDGKNKSSNDMVK